jgi:hypothetical protein
MLCLPRAVRVSVENLAELLDTNHRLDAKVSMHNPIVWITVANLLYLASYSVRDILWLRVLTLCGATLLLPYYALQPSPLVPSLVWDAVFIAINAFWIVRLAFERRPIRLSAAEARLRDLSFPSLSPREARKLYSMGMWENDRAGAQLSVIAHGIADVVHHSARVAQLGEGQFVGAIDLRAQAGTLDVVARTASLIMCWPREPFEAYLNRRPDVALALQRSIGFEVTRLLETTLSGPDASHA